MNIKVAMAFIMLACFCPLLKADLKYCIIYEDVDSIVIRSMTFRHSQAIEIDCDKFSQIYAVCDSMIRSGAEDRDWHNAKKYVVKDKVGIIMFLSMLNKIEPCGNPEKIKVPAEIELFDELLTFAQIELWTPLGKITAFTSPYVLILLNDTYYAGEIGEFIDKLSSYLSKLKTKKNRIEKIIGK